MTPEELKAIKVRHKKLMAKKLQVKQWTIKFTDSPQDFDRDKGVVRLYRTRVGANAVIKAWWKQQDIPAKAVRVNISEVQ